MKVEQYLRAVHPFHAIFIPILVGIIDVVTTIPARVVEIFLRKNFGERYYNLEIPFILFAVMIAPIGYTMYFGIPSPFNWFFGIFAFLFLYLSIQRYREVNRTKQVFDDSKFSYYSGDISKVWYGLDNKIPGFKVSNFIIEKYLEGGFFAILGLVLIFISFSYMVGIVLLVSGLSYLIKIHLRYKTARHMVLDKIDEKIINEELYDTFVNDTPPEGTKGFRWSGPKPASAALRKEVFDLMMIDEADEDAAVVS